MALSKTTQDHDEIRKWAEARGAVPADVESTEGNGQTGIIRLEFPKAPNANDSALKEISWEQFFEKFDASGLALVYQELTADGEQSNFNRFVHPENARPAPKKAGKKSAGLQAEGKNAPAKAPAKKAPAKKAALKSVPTKAAPAKKSAAKSTPAKKSPAKQAPVKQPPAKKSAAKKAAGKSAAAKKTAGKTTGR